MREIKFRAWMPGYWYMNAIPVPGKMSVYQNDYNGHLQPFPCDAICQYTGLKDKNGKEIYEGDIIKSGKGNCALGEVYFCQQHGFGSFQVRTSWTNDLICDLEEIEIIGNIYENPELLDNRE